MSPQSFYRVISHLITQKTQKIGVRMALGTTTARVMLDVLDNTLRLIVVGIALGTIASLAATQLILSLLYFASPWDARIFLGMMLSLLPVALVSGFFPARRTSRVSPMTALRNS